MRALVVFQLLLLFAGCDLPRDPEATLERVRGGTLLVGITAHPPWTALDGPQPGGIEATLVRQLAKELDSEIQWARGSEAELMQQLKQGRLDLVFGGLDDSSPWTTHAAFTRPYIDFAGKRHVMAVRHGENRWLLRLDTFLQSRRREIRRLVEAEVSP